ncbi:MAG: hypothetical protein U0T03_03305 [Xanthomonadales bacterium]|nr:hypothetical protein [Xanthomonadales bacterium]
MKAIDKEVVVCVSGGNAQSDFIQRGLEVCKGLPDNKSITLEIENTTSAGLWGTKGAITEAISFTLTCGELRESANGK